MNIKSLLFTGVVICLSVCSALSSANNVGQQTNYQAFRVDKPLQLDGQFNEAFWHSIPSTSAFVIHDTGNNGKHLTTAKIAYNSDSIFFAIKVFDDDIVANFIEPQSPLFSQDDVVEIFIDPIGHGKPYLEFGISPLNSYYSLKIIEPKYKFVSKPIEIAGLESAVFIDGTVNQSDDRDAYWQVELKLPLRSVQQLFGLTELTAWRFNLYRIDFSGALPRKANEYYSWQTLGSFGFHQPEKFGRLNFQ